MTWKQRLAERIDHEMLRRYAEAEEMWTLEEETGSWASFAHASAVDSFGYPLVLGIYQETGGAGHLFHAILSVSQAHDVCPCAAVEIIRRAAGESS